MPTLSSTSHPHRRGRHAAPGSASSLSSLGKFFSAPRGLSSVAIPAFIALCYCLYAAFIAGDNGWSTGLTWLIALVSGRWQSGRQPETVAAVYGVIFGLAMGYLLSLNGWSILKSCGSGLALAAAMAVSVFYIDHTHQRWTGRRPR
jgi:hypothetical protein